MQISSEAVGDGAPRPVNLVFLMQIPIVAVGDGAPTSRKSRFLYKELIFNRI